MEDEKSYSLEELNNKLDFIMYYLVLSNGLLSSQTLRSLKCIFVDTDVSVPEFKDKIMELGHIPHNLF